MFRIFLTTLVLLMGTVGYAQTYVLVLGIAQDGGYPHMGCSKPCCTRAWAYDTCRRNVVSLALVDSLSGKWWLFEATPDMKEQLHRFSVLTHGRYSYLPQGIFLTHAHIGHYTGLMQLGKEVMGTRNEPVYAMPRMKQFLETNGPWSQLVSQHNIEIRPLQADVALFPDPANNTISVTPVIVPHRDEYSETVGFRIRTGTKSYLFIPDINKWRLWQRSIVTEADSVDIALVDGTFFDSTELPGRNIKEVPHPFVTETMALFASAQPAIRAKIYFIHLNHTNPLLWDERKRTAVRRAGFHIAEQGDKL